MTQNKENKEVNIIDPNPNSSYKTKKKFTGLRSYTEVNPKFPDGVNIVIICTYLQLVCELISEDLGLWVH